MENEVKQNTLNFGELLDVLKKCWWLMLIVCLIGSTSMYIYSHATYKEEYTASVSIWAMKNIGTESSVQTTDLSMANYLVNDYRLQLVSDAVISRVKQADPPAYGNMTVSQLRSRVTISHEEDTRILKLSARAGTREEAKKLADTWGYTFQTYINEDKFGEQMVSFDEALTPTAPSNSVSIAKVLLIGILGAALVYGIFFLRFALDDKIYSNEDVEKYLGLTVLGAIPNKNSVVPKKDSNYRYHRKRGYYKRHHQTEK